MARILFDLPVRAVAPGQSCVLYDGETVLGGGVLTEVRNSEFGIRADSEFAVRNDSKSKIQNPNSEIA